MATVKAKTEADTRNAQNRPDEIADELIARIFVGELKAGDQLQPSRTMAKELGVDRTSLRMALRQLARMNVIRPVQGSGVTVLDYREHAGVEFIASVFALPDVDLGGAFLLESLGVWNQVMPAICAGAMKRATPFDFQKLDLLFRKQVALIEQHARIEEVVEIELEMHIALVKASGSTVLMLLTNTTLPVRRTLVRLLYDTVDPLTHVESQREILRTAMTGKVTPDEVATAYRTFWQSESQPLIDRIAQLPISPSRVQKALRLTRNRKTKKTRPKNPRS